MSDHAGAELFDHPEDVVAALAAVPRPLLLATDVDGTLAPIAPRPEQARLAPGALAALHALEECADVVVAVVSGRSLAELRGHFGLDGIGLLLGSYGGESMHAAALDEDERSLLVELTDTFAAIVAAVPGVRLEPKAMAVALHVRGATPDAAVEALGRARRAVAGDARVTVHEGHQVVEAAVRDVSKARAVAELRGALEPAAVAFLGDDLADEGVFAELGTDDVSVKVGTGPTAARWRVAAPVDVVDILTRLAAAMR